MQKCRLQLGSKHRRSAEVHAAMRVLQSRNLVAMGICGYSVWEAILGQLIYSQPFSNRFETAIPDRESVNLRKLWGCFLPLLSSGAGLRQGKAGNMLRRSSARPCVSGKAGSTHSCKPHGWTQESGFGLRRCAPLPGSCHRPLQRERLRPSRPDGWRSRAGRA